MICFLNHTVKDAKGDDVVSSANIIMSKKQVNRSNGRHSKHNVNMLCNISHISNIPVRMVR